MDEKLPTYFIRWAQTDDKEDDDLGISRDRQRASSRLDSPIVERRLVAVPAGSRTICIAGTPGRAMQYADDWSHRHDLSARHPCLRACRRLFYSPKGG